MKLIITLSALIAVSGKVVIADNAQSIGDPSINKAPRMPWGVPYGDAKTGKKSMPAVPYGGYYGGGAATKEIKTNPVDRYIGETEKNISGGGRGWGR
ncbi:MAG: hypothetical protein ABFR19_04195 [Pseudomonadota bacterium]